MLLCRFLLLKYACKYSHREGSVEEHFRKNMRSAYTTPKPEQTQTRPTHLAVMAIDIHNKGLF